MNIEITRTPSRCYSLKYHLVLVTKYRHKCINKEILTRLEDIARNIFETNYKCTLIEMSGESDHIHMLFEAPPQVQLSKLINSYKTVSSRYIRKEFAEHLAPYYWKPYFWNGSYFILSSGGAPIDVIRQYIEEQSRPKI